MSLKSVIAKFAVNTVSKSLAYALSYALSNFTFAQLKAYADRYGRFVVSLNCMFLLKLKSMLAVH